MREQAKRVFLSLHETNNLFPDHDFPSTWDNSEAFGIPADSESWTIEAVPVPLIDPRQLLDDPDDAEGQEKVESIRASMRNGSRTIPPVYVLHYPDSASPFYLIEGKHRYNAAHREGAATLTAWVGHPSCCGSQLDGED